MGRDGFHDGGYVTEISEHHKAARAAHKAGLCVVPSREDESKAPMSFWKKYQYERPTPAQIDRWYGEQGRTGVGIICGEVSGNFTMLECEDLDTWQLLKDNAESVGLDDLLNRIAEGWMEYTPGGGVHLYYRCDDVQGNKKLARRPGDVERGEKEVVTLIETRCEGGYTIIAPSSGKVHETGMPYVRVHGGPKTLETISVQDQLDLWQLCRTFDQMEAQKAEEPKYVGLLRPGDDYNNRASWRDILEPHGWRFLFERGGVWYLRRPGKDRGVSATVNWGGLNGFRNFSSSTPFDDRMYTKFGVYTVLEHRGDFSAAAKELAASGYGHRDRHSSHSVSGDGIDEEPTLEWREPDHLARPGFPTFPVHRLPYALRGFCRAVSESVQVPYDYPAMTMLGALSVAARGRYAVAVDGTSHSEPLVLQTVLFADSGTRKSNAFSIVKKPLTRYERERRKQDEYEYEEWEVRHDLAEKALKSAKSSKTTLPVEVVSLAHDFEEVKRAKPVVTRLIADDVTPEKLGTIIADQRGAIGIMAPEGGFFANIAGRYNQGIPNMEYVLRGHNGEPLIIDRMGRESYVHGAYVTIAISLQPDIVTELATVPGFRGKGMAARLLPSFPKSLVGARNPRNGKAVPKADAMVWDSVLSTILHQAEEVDVTEWGEFEPYVLSLSADAKELYFLYSEHVERQLARGGGLSTLQDWGGKMVGHALRIAGLFHLVEHGTEAVHWPVQYQTLSDAIAVMEYFVPHAKYFIERLSGMSYGESLDELMRVLRDIPEPIYRSGVYQRLRSHKTYRGNKDFINDSLDELELLGYIRIMPERGTKVRIELNPSVEGAVRYTSFEAPDAPDNEWTFDMEEDDEDFDSET